MADNLSERFDALKQKKDAEGWPICKKCMREMFRVKPSGICGECDPPKQAVAVVKKKEPSVYDQVKSVTKKDYKDVASGESAPF